MSLCLIVNKIKKLKDKKGKPIIDKETGKIEYFGYGTCLDSLTFDYYCNEYELSNVSNYIDTTKCEYTKKECIICRDETVETNTHNCEQCSKNAWLICKKCNSELEDKYFNGTEIGEKAGLQAGKALLSST